VSFLLASVDLTAPVEVCLTDPSSFNYSLPASLDPSPEVNRRLLPPLRPRSLRHRWTRLDSHLI